MAQNVSPFAQITAFGSHVISNGNGPMVMVPVNCFLIPAQQFPVMFHQANSHYVSQDNRGYVVQGTATSSSMAITDMDDAADLTTPADARVIEVLDSTQQENHVYSDDHTQDYSHHFDGHLNPAFDLDADDKQAGSSSTYRDVAARLCPVAP